MAERIYRYEVPVDGEWHDFDLRGIPLHVGCRDVWVVEFWAIDNGLGTLPYRFRVVGTGEPLPEGARYWGTAVAPGGRLVWHLVEADRLWAQLENEPEHPTGQPTQGVTGEVSR